MNLHYESEEWPVDGVFRISRGSVTSVCTLRVELREGDLMGRGEGTPYAYFGQSMEGCFEQLEQVRPAVEEGLERADLQDLLPPTAARNALDCALWDLEAKRSGIPVWKTAGLARFEPVTSAYTISVDEPATMAAHASRARQRPLLKVKLGGGDDLPRITAVQAAAPSCRMIVDANEAWSLEDLTHLAPELAKLGVELIEQPLPAGDDADLEGYRGPVPLCADESCRHRASLDSIEGRYQFINIKLDKTGGLTEALLLADAAEEIGLGLMVGCMLGTSLAMAPATIVANRCDFVDLDGPLLLAADRTPAIEYRNSVLMPPLPTLWG